MTIFPPLSTFSIAACDLEAQEWGVAVASRFLAVGAVVPWARAGIGAVATQASANTSFGPLGLDLLAHGYSAQDALTGLVAADAGRAQRQVGLVDGQGGAASFTGEECYHWAGGRTGRCCAAQGNILTGPEVVDRMVERFEASDGPLAQRLLRALGAGQEAGGDSRGQQSAALLVARSRGGYGGFNDRFVDLRVDDHETPITALEGLLAMHRLYFWPPRPEDVRPIDEALAREIQQIVRAGGAETPLTGRYDEATQRAFRALADRENLEGRWREGPEVDLVALGYLRRKYAP